MPPSPSKGRWVILFDDHTPPALWSAERETLEAICHHLRRACPTARVTWQAAPEFSIANRVHLNEDDEE